MTPVCDQCGEAEAVFCNDDKSHRICQDCSDLNLTAHLLGAKRAGLAVLKKDEGSTESVPFYVAPPRRS